MTLMNPRPVAKIEDATLNPTKQEVASRWLGSFSHLGSYRLVDVDGEVGIESLLGFDSDERLIQLPVTYRSAQLDEEETLATMDHSVLGTRYVTNALADPVAVREYIRIILDAADGANYSDGTRPALLVRGSGVQQPKGEKPVELGEVNIYENTRQRATGWVEVEGKSRAFLLRIPQILVPEGHPSIGHSVSSKRLVGGRPDHPEREFIVAELAWTDMHR